MGNFEYYRKIKTTQDSHHYVVVVQNRVESVLSDEIHVAVRSTQKVEDRASVGATGANKSPLDECLGGLGLVAILGGFYWPVKALTEA